MGSSIESFIMKTLCIVSILSSSTLAQLKFGNSGNSDDKIDTKKKDVDTKFFTGNEALDGGIVGLGAGLLGGAVLGGVLGGGNNNGCGRRIRQADGTNTKFLGALLGGSGGCNCGRRRRQAPGEDQPGTRFFGLENLLGGGNNCCNCGYNSGYNNVNTCQCRYDL